MIIDLDYEVVKMPIDGWWSKYLTSLKMSYKILAATASKNYEFLLRHSNRIESYGKLESLIFDQSCLYITETAAAIYVNDTSK